VLARRRKIRKKTNPLVKEKAKMENLLKIPKLRRTRKTKP
jgi:hypothetical protein